MLLNGLIMVFFQYLLLPERLLVGKTSSLLLRHLFDHMAPSGSVHQVYNLRSETKSLPSSQTHGWYFWLPRPCPTFVAISKMKEILDNLTRGTAQYLYKCLPAGTVMDSLSVTSPPCLSANDP